jgi:alkaline phosphatase D
LLEYFQIQAMRLSFYTLVTVTLISTLIPAAAKFPDNFNATLEVIAFGSCNRDELPQPLWPVITENAPQLWIWGGDNIYADWYENPDGKKEHYTVNREWITKRYASQFEHAAYTAFRQTTPIIGTWDDHDYGRNNAGINYELKTVTRDLSLSFMEVPISDPRWQREGIYGAYDFGPKGQRTKIILTDNRYFATGKDAKTPELLGQVQRAWLERTLRESDADLHLIVSGTQILSAEHKYEKWADFPETRQWLLDLIRETGMPMTILLSGDRHIHEISVLADDTLDYPLVDATSSGLTHPWIDFPGETNSLRHGEVFANLGFGLLRIDWSGTSPKVMVEIRDQTNQVQNHIVVERTAQTQ